MPTFACSFYSHFPWRYSTCLFLCQLPVIGANVGFAYCLLQVDLWGEIKSDLVIFRRSSFRSWNILNDTQIHIVSNPPASWLTISIILDPIDHCCAGSRTWDWPYWTGCDKAVRYCELYQFYLLNQTDISRWNFIQIFLQMFTVKNIFVLAKKSWTD